MLMDTPIPAFLFNLRYIEDEGILYNLLTLFNKLAIDVGSVFRLPFDSEYFEWAFELESAQVTSQAFELLSNILLHSGMDQSLLDLALKYAKAHEGCVCKTLLDFFAKNCLHDDQIFKFMVKQLTSANNPNYENALCAVEQWIFNGEDKYHWMVLLGPERLVDAHSPHFISHLRLLGLALRHEAFVGIIDLIESSGCLNIIRYALKDSCIQTKTAVISFISVVSEVYGYNHLKYFLTESFFDNLADFALLENPLPVLKVIMTAIDYHPQRIPIFMEFIEEILSDTDNEEVVNLAENILQKIG